MDQSQAEGSDISMKFYPRASYNSVFYWNKDMSDSSNLLLLSWEISIEQLKIQKIDTPEKW